MLKQLYIKDFTLIDELNIQFFPGFSVITGETGAGKSIVIGALHLLLGQQCISRVADSRDRMRRHLTNRLFRMFFVT